MEFRKALLGAASLLALTAGGQKPADASVPPADLATPAHHNAAIALHGDPLFELMAKTNGSLRLEPVEGALREMFVNPSSAQVEALPHLLAGLSGLGASSDVVAGAKTVLMEIVASAVNVDDQVAETTLTKLHSAGPNTVKLAALKRRHRIPDEIGQVGAPTPVSSDLRLKHDIALVDRLSNGLGLYRFSYIGEDKAYVGVMAQEVAQIMPDAVVEGDDGYLRVRYDMLGIRMQSWEEWTGSGRTMSATSTRH